MELHKFNKKSAVNQLHIKYNKNKCIKIETILICIFIVSFCVIFYTYSKFISSKKFKVVQTTVGDFSSKDYSIAYYLDDVSIDTAPTSDSGDGILKITCNNDATATWNKDTWNISITSTKTGTKCSAYFTSDSTKVDNSYYTAVNTTSDDYKAGYIAGISGKNVTGVFNQLISNTEFTSYYWLGSGSHTYYVQPTDTSLSMYIDRQATSNAGSLICAQSSRQIDFSKVQYIRITYTYSSGAVTYFGVGYGSAGTTQSTGSITGFTPDSTFTTFEELASASSSRSVVIDVSNYNDTAYLKFELLTANGANYSSSCSASITNIEYY